MSPERWMAVGITLIVVGLALVLVDLTVGLTKRWRVYCVNVEGVEVTEVGWAYTRRGAERLANEEHRAITERPSPYRIRIERTRR